MIILDTNVLVAALRSKRGRSREIVRKVLVGELEAGVSVPLFLEYEAVLTRPEHLEAFALSAGDVVLFLDRRPPPSPTAQTPPTKGTGG